MPRPHALMAFNYIWKVVHFDGCITIFSPFFQPFDEFSGGAFTFGISIEEEKFLGIGPGQSGPDNVVTGGSDNFVHVLAALWARACQDEFADELGVGGHQGLGNYSAKGGREDINGLESQCLDEFVGAFRHLFNGVLNLPGGGADPLIVDGDDMAVAAMGSRIRGSQLSKFAAK